MLGESPGLLLFKGKYFTLFENEYLLKVYERLGMGSYVKK